MSEIIKYKELSLKALDTKRVTYPCVPEMVAYHIDKGKEKFDDFMKSLQVVGERSKFYETSKKIKYNIFRQ